MTTDSSGRFQQGNPGKQEGTRSKRDLEIEAHAKLYAKRAIDIANTIMESTEDSATDRLKACQFIVDRAYGRPKEHVTVAHDRSVSERPDFELEAIIASGRGGNGIAQTEKGTSKPH